MLVITELGSTCSDLGFEPGSDTGVLHSFYRCVLYDGKKISQAYKEVVLKLLKHRSPESRAFNMLLKIKNQHVMIRMNYGVSYLTDILG